MDTTSSGSDSVDISHVGSLNNEFNIEIDDSDLVVPSSFPGTRKETDIFIKRKIKIDHIKEDDMDNKKEDNKDDKKEDNNKDQNNSSSEEVFKIDL